MRSRLIGLSCLLALVGQANAQGVDWPGVGNDPGCMRYSPLDQIHRGNVDRLRPAWIYHTGELEGRPGKTIECTPIVVEGVMYLTTGYLRVVALDAEAGAITLVEQFRYPVGQRLWELPMGMWEERPDATPGQIAAGELVEETGLAAATMTRAGTLFQGPGYSNQQGHVFLATGLTQTATAREQTEQDMVARTFPLAEVEAEKVEETLESPAAGTIVEIKVPEGETVEVRTPVAVIETTD